MRDFCCCCGNPVYGVSEEWIAACRPTYCSIECKELVIGAFKMGLEHCTRPVLKKEIVKVKRAKYYLRKKKGANQ